MLARLKRLPWFEIALVSVVMLVHLRAALAGAHSLPSRWFLRDDAYYYFKVAQNISQGLGSTFDGINPTNGYHPLWLLVNIPLFALARFDLILPLRLLILVQAALSAAGGVLLYRLLKASGIRAPLAMLAASFWCFDLTLHNTLTQQGLETGLLAFSLLLLLSAVQRWQRQPDTFHLLLVSGAAILALFSRLDAIYLAAFLGIWLIFRGHALRFLLPLDLLTVFSAAVIAVTQRAGLKTYLYAFSSSTLTAAAFFFTLQTVLFFALDLYRPQKYRLRDLFLRLLLAYALTGGLLFGANYFLEKIPRLAPALLMGISLPISLGLRLITKILPRSLTLADEEPGSPLSLLRCRAAAWLRTGLTYGLPLAFSLTAYMGLNRWLFGTFMPVSGQIKRWWGFLSHDIYGGDPKSLLDVFGLDPLFSAAWNPYLGWSAKWGEALSAPYLPLLFLALIALLLLWRVRRENRAPLPALLPLLAAAEIQVLFYYAMPYAAKQEWYWAPQILTGLLTLTAGVDAALQVLPAPRPLKMTGWAAASLVCAWLAWTFSSVIIQRMPLQDALAGQPYLDMTTLLEQNTEPGALIGMTGGGNVAYFIQGRTIVNMDGLINSYAYFQANQNRRGADYLAQMGLDYVFVNPAILDGTEPYSWQFKNRLEPVPGAPAYGGKQLLRFR